MMLIGLPMYLSAHARRTVRLLQGLGDLQHRMYGERRFMRPCDHQILALAIHKGIFTPYQSSCSAYLA